MKQKIAKLNFHVSKTELEFCLFIYNIYWECQSCCYLHLYLFIHAHRSADKTVGSFNLSLVSFFYDLNFNFKLENFIFVPKSQFFQLL